MAAERRKVLPPDVRKEEILTAAAGTFSEKGYRDSSVTDIIDSAGIARGTFYHYFESKKEVFLALVESYFEGFAGALEECHARLEAALDGGASPFEAWKDYALGILRFHSENPELTALVYREAMSQDRHFSSKVEEFSDLGRGRIAEDLRMMVERGLMLPCDIEIAATIITGAAVSIIMEYIVRRKSGDLEALAVELARNQVRALLPPGVNIDGLLGIT